MEMHHLPEKPPPPYLPCLVPFSRAITSCLNLHRPDPPATSTVPRKAAPAAPCLNRKSTKFRPSKTPIDRPPKRSQPSQANYTIPDRQNHHISQFKPLPPVSPQNASKAPPAASVPIRPISLERPLQPPNGPLPPHRLTNPPNRRHPPARTPSPKHDHMFSTNPSENRPPKTPPSDGPHPTADIGV